MPHDQEAESRRRFMSRAAALGVSSVAALGRHRQAWAAEPADAMRQFLRPYVVPREVIESFLDPKARVWAKFHPTYGYLLRNSFVRDGQDGSHTLARYEADGQRQQVNFRDQPCRINTYGDSFTQGHQVSDGETWQEMLAAHFCEPIRNYGIGGFGVYQAYRRLLENEATPNGAKYLIFNIYGDDHYRSIYAWRWLSFQPAGVKTWSGDYFHANPWVHARLDRESGELVERENLCPDEATLRKLADPEFVYATFGNDEIVCAMLAVQTGLIANQEKLDLLAATVRDERADWSDRETIRSSAKRILHSYAVRVGMKIMDKAHAFARANDKKLLVLLSYPASSVAYACGERPRDGASDSVDWHPREFKEFLEEKGIPYVDSLPKHVAEFATFRLSPREYVNRYYIGHYTPRGNNFFAFAIKDKLLAWLDPKPPAYRDDGEPLIRFQGYLPG